MKNSLIIVLAVMMFSACTATRNKTTEILVLGDMHYDRIENHDLAWLAEQGDDLRQVTTEYTVFTGILHALGERTDTHASETERNFGQGRYLSSFGRRMHAVRAGLQRGRF